jgi:L-rhamnose-H+ transport protein
MILGLILATSCGASWGLYLAPMRLVKVWKWENIWALWSVVGLLIGPLLVAIFTVPHYWQVNRDVGLGILALTVLIGAISGMSGFLYSMTVPVIGLGLATALNGGSSMVMTLLPLFVLHRKTVLHSSGVLTLLGVTLSVIGIAYCGKGGELREKELGDGQSQEQPAEKAGKLSFVKSVVACCIAGAISSGMNIALAFPNPIFEVAHKYGSTDFGAANAFLAPYLIGGFFSNILYSLYLLRKNSSFSRFVAPGALRFALWSVFMAVVFLFGVSAYAGAVGLMGSFGAVIAWGVSMAAMILISGIWDVYVGEWKGQPLRIMAVGIGVLMVAIVALGLAEYFHQIETMM